jgi:hypothetical protein
MIDNKLIKIYLKLDKKQLRKLKKWIHSPLHNKHQIIQKVFLLLGRKTVYNATTLNKKHIWKSLYPNQIYNDLRMRHTLSISVEVLENFVRFYLYDQDTFYKNKLLSDWYLRQNFPEKAQQILLNTKKEIKPLQLDEFYYCRQYELEKLLFEIEGTQNSTRTTNLSTILGHARLAFMIATLRHAYIALTHQSLKKVTYDVPMLDSILIEIEKKTYQEYAVLQIYYHAYQSLKAQNAYEHFEQLKQYLYDIPLSKKEKRATLLICINYAAKQLNTGNTVWVRQTFELYQYGLQKDYLIENGKLNIFTYVNIVTLGLNLKEFDWTKYFIENYSQYIPAHLRENYQHYNTAKLAFDKGNFDDAMTLLRQIEYDDLMLNIGAKVMLLKIYYQENYYETLNSFFDSFRVFLNRKKMLSYHKKNYLNLIKLSKKLMHLPNMTTKDIEVLQDKINSIPQLAERKWLIKQVQEKINKY